MAKSYGKIFEEQVVEPGRRSKQEDQDKIKELTSAGHIAHARKLLKKSGVDLSSLQMANVAGIKGRPEPKTDIYYRGETEEYKISVKYGDAIQLCSINKDTTQKYLSLAASNAGLASEPDIKDLIESISSFPKKVTRKEFNAWAAVNREGATRKVRNLLRKYPKLRYCFTEIALTGKGLLPDDRAEANYVLTEKEFFPITKEYIEKCSEKMSPRFASKSRGGIADATLRVDMSMGVI